MEENKIIIGERNKKTDKKTIIFFGIVVLIFIAIFIPVLLSSIISTEDKIPILFLILVLIIGFIVTIIIFNKEPKELFVYYKDTKDFMMVYGQSTIQHRKPAKLHISHIDNIKFNKFKFNYYVFFVVFSLANLEITLINGETLRVYGLKDPEKVYSFLSVLIKEETEKK